MLRLSLRQERVCGYLLKYSPHGKDELEQQHAAGLMFPWGFSHPTFW